MLGLFLTTFALFLPAQMPVLQPAPHEITYDEGKTFALPPGAPLVIPDDTTAAERRMLDTVLGDWRMTIVPASRIKAGSPAIYVGERERNEAIDNRKVSRALTAMRTVGPEGYRLAVTEDFIVVSGGGPRGTFYGLQTLKQLAGPAKVFPVVAIRDEPDVKVRGVHLREPATPDALARLASLKCNVILYESEDFGRLEGDAATRWRAAFESARAFGIEPVPVLDFIAQGASMLRGHPEWAEGLAAEETVFFEDDIPAPLSEGHVLADGPGDIVVRYNNRICVPGEDYQVLPGDTAYPYDGTDAKWRLLRTKNSAVPAGAPVAVRYAYAPAYSTTLRPYADGLFDALEDSFQGIAKTLEPRLVHLGMSVPERMGRDPRSAAGTAGAWFAEAYRQVNGAAKIAFPRAGRMVWADGLTPRAASGQPFTLDLAGDVILCVRTGGAEALRWAAESNHEFILGVSGGPSAAYAAAKGVSALARDGVGVFASDDDRVGETALFETAWSAGVPLRLWPEMWNGYFGAELWSPTYDEMLAVMARHLDRRIWQARTPDAEFDDFDRAVKAIRDRSLQDALRADVTYNLYRTITAYVALEAQFAASRDQSILTRVAALVERHAAYAPDWPEARTRSIVETMQRLGGVVPSTLLFGTYLAPYRGGPPLGGGLPLLVSAEPAYRDREHSIEATFDLLAPGLDVYRAEFNSFGISAPRFEASDDGVAWTNLETRSNTTGPPWSPLQTVRPTGQRYLRISADTAAPAATLRDARLVALAPEPAKSVAHISASRNPADGFRAVAGLSPVIAAFRNREGALAKAPVLVRAGHDGIALFVVAELYDDRPETIVSERLPRDADGDGLERFYVRIEGAEGDVFTFGIDPLGALMDKRNADGGWNGEWTGNASRTPSGWRAQFAIPLKLLGWASAPPQSIAADFLRHRRNVTNEDASWAGSPGGDPRTLVGRLVLE